MREAPPEAGLFASLRRMLATLSELLQTRLELVSVEVEEQLQYALELMLWSVAAIFFATTALLLLALTVVIAFWDSHRLLAAVLVTVAFLVAALAAALGVRRRLRRRPKFMAATVAELGGDADALRRDRS